MKINIIEKIFLILISVIISLCIAELILRFFPRYNLECFSADSNFWEAKSGLHRPSKLLGYEPIPNSSPAINSFGMFDKEYNFKKEKNIYRIIVLGDSITAHGEYTKFLEDKLSRNNSGRNFEVWNCGVGGFNIEQYANYLKYKAMRYNSDMIMIGFCLNDFLIGIPVAYNTDKNTLIVYYNPYTKTKLLMNKFLFRYSNLYRFFMLSLDKVLLNVHFPKMENNSEKTGYMCLKTIRDIAKKRNSLLFGVVFPYLKPLNEYTEFEKNEYNTMVKVLKQLDIDFIDLHLYLSNIDLYKWRQKSDDKHHFIKEGHSLCADIIYGYLKTNFKYRKKTSL